MEQWMMGFEKFGLAGLLAMAGTGLLFLVVKWTLATTKDILAQAAEERKIFNAMQTQWIEALNRHTTQAQVFHDDMKMAHDYQRQEHMKMMEMVQHCGARQ